jgi:hypothetical protein
MATQAMAERTPFPLTEKTGDPWREQALTRIGEQRFVLAWILAKQPPGTVPPDLEQTIRDHWDAAALTAKSGWRRGAVARVNGHLDAADASLLRIAPDAYVLGQLPGILVRVERFLPKDDIRRSRVRTLAVANGKPALKESDRDLIVAALHAAGKEEGRAIARLRSFTNMLYGAAAVLLIAAVAFAVLAAFSPGKVPICFSPGGNVVCATATDVVGGKAPPDSPQRAKDIDQAMRSAANPGDVALIEVVGLLAAALAAATALRRIRGTSTPFRLPLAVALLKLPTGALTAVLGLILMRGAFVPGLSALDSPGQIVSWAVVLGYSQQILTRMVDDRAQTVLDNFARTREEQDKENNRLDAKG